MSHNKVVSIEVKANMSYGEFVEAFNALSDSPAPEPEPEDYEPWGYEVEDMGSYYKLTVSE